MGRQNSDDSETTSHFLGDVDGFPAYKKEKLYQNSVPMQLTPTPPTPPPPSIFEDGQLNVVFGLFSSFQLTYRVTRDKYFREF